MLATRSLLTLQLRETVDCPLCLTSRDTGLVSYLVLTSNTKIGDYLISRRSDVQNRRFFQTGAYLNRLALL